MVGLMLVFSVDVSDQRPQHDVASGRKEFPYTLFPRWARKYFITRCGGAIRRLLPERQ